MTQHAAEGTATAGDPRRILTSGELSVTGRLTDSSNVSLVGTVELDGVALDCVYKPIRGERPLWDFPDGTLAHREVAAFRISELAGWDCVPLTVLRSGPFGPGMAQQWIDAPDFDQLVDVMPPDELPAGWLPVLQAADAEGRPLLVAHADDARLQVIAGFDLVVNNADRKASHLLPTADGRVLGVDHGLTLHQAAKLRTILWGWAGRPLPVSVLDGLDRLDGALAGAAVAQEFAGYLTVGEVTALLRRIDTLRRQRRFPRPPEDRTPIPWPPL